MPGACLSLLSYIIDRLSCRVLNVLAPLALIKFKVDRWLLNLALEHRMIKIRLS